MYDGKKVTLQGFPNTPNLDQYLGRIQKERPMQDLIIIADKASKLMKENKGKTEEVPAINYGKDTEPEEQQLLPPPGGDLGLGGPGAPPGMSPPGGSPMGGMGDIINQPLSQGMRPPMGMPSSSLRSITRSLDSIADAVQRKGYKVLASRIDIIANTLDQGESSDWTFDTRYWKQRN